MNWWLVLSIVAFNVIPALFIADMREINSWKAALLGLVFGPVGWILAARLPEHDSMVSRE